jgi:4-amino-4-deoxy-L-arabinose transferase-like glycosyltransferase
LSGKQQVWLLAAILMLSLIHGGMYASYMPAWGLVDEEQHFHYIQSLVEQHFIPVTGKAMLSPEIVDSVFETRRWERFMWPAPSSRNTADMGLEGQSYEGYQPPLYYLVLAPLYSIWPGSILSRLFALRWASVALSLVSVLLVFQTARYLFGSRSPLPYLAALFLAIVPERAAAVARVNNDVAVEVMGSAVILLCTFISLRGPSWRSSLVVGVTFGMAVLAKVSGGLLIVPIAMSFWRSRSDRRVLLHALLAGCAALIVAAPWAVRNLRVYGDLTGSRGFDRIANLPLPAFSVQGLAAAVWDLWRHFWYVWWKGATASGNWLTFVADMLLVVLLVLSIVGLVEYVRRLRVTETQARNTYVLAVYVVAILTYAVMIVLGYFGSNFPLFGGRLLVPVVAPVIQGRYFLPVIGPVVILFTLGLWQQRLRSVLLPAAVAAIGALSLGSLFGNLLPFHYFWGPVEARGIPASSLAEPSAWRFLISEMISDKPELIRWILAPLTAAFVVLGCTTALLAHRAALRSES